jgi:quinol monooxygenase YgiN
MAVVLIATFEPEPDRREDVLAAFEEGIPRVHKEDAGCELYALHQEGGKFVLIEKWESMEALTAHATSPAFTELATKLPELLANPFDLRILEPHPVGDPAQGAL